ncbi:hypothetical protein B0O99DRAFT_67980 [Bisporella sp. PMI_857]|nr:hypothetical protein B0O99DRAFT_67980 [Bisporella sp. PMI_857]
MTSLWLTLFAASYPLKIQTLHLTHLLRIAQPLWIPSLRTMFLPIGTVAPKTLQILPHKPSIFLRTTHVYRTDSFAMTLAQIQEKADKFQFKYRSHDIVAYTSIFSLTTDTVKALNTLLSNA